VGQGFLLYGSATGGNILFNNSQRVFAKEVDADSNVLFRQQQTVATPINFDDVVAQEDPSARIRLGFNSYNGFHRQLLIGFMNDRATDGLDVGYDAIQIDNQPNDMVFLAGDSPLVIQGVGPFNVGKVYPLGLKVASAGTVSFTLDGTENFNPEQQIYIHDNASDTYHDIRESAFVLDLPAGTINDRFSLRFTDSTLGTADFLTDGAQIDVRYTNSNNMLTIVRLGAVSQIESVALFNVLGQVVSRWNVADAKSTAIQIPVGKLSSGTYLVSVHTSQGDISKKIILK
jgi:hypothetical protein